MHSLALAVPLPGVVQWREGWGGYLFHVVQAHVDVLEVAGLILRGTGGGGHCSFHCLNSITYQNLPRLWRTCTPFQSPPFLNRPYTISTNKTNSGLIDLTQYVTYQIESSGRTVAYYSAILRSKKDCTQWSISTAGHRCRKQIRSVEAMLCHMKLSRMIFSKVFTFRLQNKAFFQRCISLSLVLTHMEHSIYMENDMIINSLLLLEIP